MGQKEKRQRKAKDGRKRDGCRQRNRKNRNREKESRRKGGKEKHGKFKGKATTEVETNRKIERKFGEKKRVKNRRRKDEVSTVENKIK